MGVVEEGDPGKGERLILFMWGSVREREVRSMLMVFFRLYRDGPYMPPPPSDVADPASLQELQVFQSTLKCHSYQIYIMQIHEVTITSKLSILILT